MVSSLIVCGKLLKILVIFVSITLLPSCIGIIAAGAGATFAVATYSDKRSMGKIVDDKSIYLRISKLFLQSDFKDIFMKIRVNIVEGRVMLTGTLKNEQNVREVIRLVWSVEHVREVINELRVSKNLPKRGLEMYIVSKINSALLVSKDISSSNYIVDVQDDTAYVIGISENRAELKKALNIISGISGIRRVVSHMIMRDDSRRAQ